MKKLTAFYRLLFLSIITGFTVSFCLAQTKFTEKKIGHIYYLNVPDYMSSTSGLHEDASCQYSNKIKETYLMAMDETKDVLEQANAKFADLEEYNEFIFKNYKTPEAIEESNYKIKTKNFIKTKNGNGVILTEMDAVFDGIKISYLIGTVETKDCFYRIYNWTLSENYDTMKNDFREIILSLKD